MFDQHYTEIASHLLGVPCMLHKDPQQRSYSWFLFCFHSTEEYEIGLLKGGYHQFLYCCVFNQEILNQRGAKSFELYFISLILGKFR